MTKYKNKYRTTSARLKGWDYTSAWWYYVTINTKNHEEFFGAIIDGKMNLNKLGELVETEWLKTEDLRDKIELDYYVIMPNHLHGIVIINNNKDTASRNVWKNVSKKNVTKENIFFSEISPKANSLSVVIRCFKGAVTKSVEELGYKYFKWQPKFYDRIIRDEKELFRIRKYIEQNPLRWEIDNDKNENICDDLLYFNYER